MRPVLILGWVTAFTLAAFDFLLEAARRDPARLVALGGLLVLLWVLRRTITREP